MKTRLWSIGIVLIGCAAAIACVSYPYTPVASAPVAPAAAPQGGSDQPFYDDLAPYGRWVYAAGPGWVWSPYNVQAGWRPYQVGHWVVTDYGWTWASDEQFGSVVYHYGRWNQDPSYGWVWVPGTEWGPAWVAWHEGGGYVGWAPLPSQVRVQVGIGLDWGGINVSIQPSLWSFVDARHLVEPGLQSHIMPPARNVTLIQVTRNVTNYTYIDNRVVNQGVRVDTIGRAVGHTIPRYHLAETTSSDVPRGGKVRGQDFVVFRPDPSRGRKSQGRLVPPGHDEAHHDRDSRQAPPTLPTAPASQTAPPAGGPSNPPAAPQSPGTQAPTAQAPATQSPANQPHGRDDEHGRGHKFLDKVMGKESPRNNPQQSSPAGTAPGQPPASTPPATSAPPTNSAPPTTPGSPASSTPAGAPGQGAAPSGPAAGRSDNQGSGGQHGVGPASGKPAPENPQAAKARGKGPKDDASKPGKGKPDKQKSDGSDSDKSKADKPDSNH